jgi:hypothetical protein
LTKFTKSNFENLTLINLTKIKFNKTISSILNFKIRSSLLILKNNKGEFHKNLNESITNHFSENPKDKICIIDFNITNPIVEPFTYNNCSNEKLLIISFREILSSVVEKGKIFLLGFKDLESDLIISDMFFIYIYERIFFQIIKNFNPSLILVYTNNNIITNDVNSKFNLTGDCNYKFI